MTSILLVTVDSLRADHLSCYGYERETTPFLDGIAEDGHVFEQAFAHAPTTRKSFPAILTSSYPLMYGGYERISEHRTLISEVLSEEGYETAGFHSNPYLSAEFGYGRGFDSFHDSQTGPSVFARIREYVSKNLDPEGRFFQFLKRSFETTEKHAGLEVGSAYVDAAVLTDMAIDWLETTSAGEPSFLWVHYMDVHHPYLPDKNLQRDFRDSPVSERRAVQLRRKMLNDPDGVTEAERQTLIDLYDAEISYTDHHIKRLVEAATEQWSDEFVFAATADHGEEFYEHGRYSHNTFYDEGIHVPLIIHDSQSNGRYKDVVGLIDLSPTLAEYAGAEQPENFYGHCLQRLISDSKWPRDHVIGNSGEVEVTEREFFYRDNRWKYLRVDDREQLHDLDVDPHEQSNVIKDHLETCDSIRSVIDEHNHLLERTRQELSQVDMDDDVRERLQLLGYKE
jgi:arylsulfatase A-like enzyme